MNETPRTDPFYGRWATYYHNGKSLFAHAVDLERELAAMTAAKNRALEALRKILVEPSKPRDADWERDLFDLIHELENT